jgi:ABC-type uncharacterized transport system substrate-binding protein
MVSGGAQGGAALRLAECMSRIAVRDDDAGGQPASARRRAVICVRTSRREHASRDLGRAFALRAGAVGLLLTLGFSPAGADSVALLLSGSGELYGRVVNGVRDGMVADPTLAQLQLNTVQLGDLPRARSSDLTVAVGSAACERVLSERRRPPLLCALIPKAGFERLAGESPPADVSAIFLDQPLSRQLQLARALLPAATRAGVLAGPDLRPMMGAVRRDGRDAGFALDVEIADDERMAARSIQRLVARNDLILPVYDPAVLTPSTAKWLLHLAYRDQRPVIGFSRAYVDAGAAAAVFSTPEQIGRQAGRAVSTFFRGAVHRLPKPSHAQAFEVRVNRRVAASLGLEPASDESLTRQVEQRLEASR